jgi:hypothetical protein
VFFGGIDLSGSFIYLEHMKQHSMIIDDFLDNPQSVRDLLLDQPMIDYLADDGVVYPGIIKMPGSVEDEIYFKLNYLFQKRVDRKCTMFARLSFNQMNPPHWAHSDFNMTHLVRHKETGMETHPETDDQKNILLSQANDRDKWDVVFTCPSRFNRMFILNAHYLHAAATKFGDSKSNSRLVCTTFFNLD